MSKTSSFFFSEGEASSPAEDKEIYCVKPSALQGSRLSFTKNTSLEFHFVQDTPATDRQSGGFSFESQSLRSLGAEVKADLSEDSPNVNTRESLRCSSRIHGTSTVDYQGGGGEMRKSGHESIKGSSGNGVRKKGMTTDKIPRLLSSSNLMPARFHERGRPGAATSSRQVAPEETNEDRAGGTKRAEASHTRGMEKGKPILEKTDSKTAHALNNIDGNGGLAPDGVGDCSAAPATRFLKALMGANKEESKRGGASEVVGPTRGAEEATCDSKGVVRRASSISPSIPSLESASQDRPGADVPVGRRENEEIPSSSAYSPHFSVSSVLPSKINGSNKVPAVLGLGSKSPATSTDKTFNTVTRKMMVEENTATLRQPNENLEKNEGGRHERGRVDGVGARYQGRRESEQWGTEGSERGSEMRTRPTSLSSSPRGMGVETRRRNQNDDAWEMPAKSREELSLSKKDARGLKRPKKKVLQSPPRHPPHRSIALLDSRNSTPIRPNSHTPSATKPKYRRRKGQENKDTHDDGGGSFSGNGAGTTASLISSSSPHASVAARGKVQRGFAAFTASPSQNSKPAHGGNGSGERVVKEKNDMQPGRDHRQESCISSSSPPRASKSPLPKLTPECLVEPSPLPLKVCHATPPKVSSPLKKSKNGQGLANFMRHLFRHSSKPLNNKKKDQKGKGKKKVPLTAFEYNSSASIQRQHGGAATTTQRGGRAEDTQLSPPRLPPKGKSDGLMPAELIVSELPPLVRTSPPVQLKEPRRLLARGAEPGAEVFRDAGEMQYRDGGGGVVRYQDAGEGQQSVSPPPTRSGGRQPWQGLRTLDALYASRNNERYNQQRMPRGGGNEWTRPLFGDEEEEEEQEEDESTISEKDEKKAHRRARGCRERVDSDSSESLWEFSPPHSEEISPEDEDSGERRRRKRRLKKLKELRRRKRTEGDKENESSLLDELLSRNHAKGGKSRSGVNEMVGERGVDAGAQGSLSNGRHQVNEAQAMGLGPTLPFQEGMNHKDRMSSEGDRRGGGGEGDDMGKRMNEQSSRQENTKSVIPREAIHTRNYPRRKYVHEEEDDERMLGAEYKEDIDMKEFTLHLPSGTTGGEGEGRREGERAGSTPHETGNGARGTGALGGVIPTAAPSGDVRPLPGSQGVESQERLHSSVQRGGGEVGGEGRKGWREESRQTSSVFSQGEKTGKEEEKREGMSPETLSWPTLHSVTEEGKGREGRNAVGVGVKNRRGERGHPSMRGSENDWGLAGYVRRNSSGSKGSIHVGTDDQAFSSRGRKDGDGSKPSFDFVTADPSVNDARLVPLAGHTNGDAPIGLNNNGDFGGPATGVTTTVTPHAVVEDTNTFLFLNESTGVAASLQSSKGEPMTTKDGKKGPHACKVTRVGSGGRKGKEKISGRGKGMIKGTGRGVHKRFSGENKHHDEKHIRRKMHLNQKESAHEALSLVRRTRLAEKEALLEQELQKLDQHLSRCQKRMYLREQRLERNRRSAVVAAPPPLPLPATAVDNAGENNTGGEGGEAVLLITAAPPSSTLNSVSTLSKSGAASARDKSALISHSPSTSWQKSNNSGEEDSLECVFNRKNTKAGTSGVPANEERSQVEKADSHSLHHDEKDDQETRKMRNQECQSREDTSHSNHSFSSSSSSFNPISSYRVLPPSPTPKTTRLQNLSGCIQERAVGGAEEQRRGEKREKRDGDSDDALAVMKGNDSSKEEDMHEPCQMDSSSTSAKSMLHEFYDSLLYQWESQFSYGAGAAVPLPSHDSVTTATTTRYVVVGSASGGAVPALPFPSSSSPRSSSLGGSLLAPPHRRIGQQEEVKTPQGTRFYSSLNTRSAGMRRSQSPRSDVSSPLPLRVPDASLPFSIPYHVGEGMEENRGRVREEGGGSVVYMSSAHDYPPSSAYALAILAILRDACDTSSFSSRSLKQEKSSLSNALDVEELVRLMRLVRKSSSDSWTTRKERKSKKEKEKARDEFHESGGVHGKRKGSVVSCEDDHLSYHSSNEVVHPVEIECMEILLRDGLGFNVPTFSSSAGIHTTCLFSFEGNSTAGAPLREKDSEKAENNATKTPFPLSSNFSKMMQWPKRTKKREAEQKGEKDGKEATKLKEDEEDSLVDPSWVDDRTVIHFIEVLATIHHNMVKESKRQNVSPRKSRDRLNKNNDEEESIHDDDDGRDENTQQEQVIREAGKGSAVPGASGEKRAEVSNQSRPLSSPLPSPFRNTSAVPFRISDPEIELDEQEGRICGALAETLHHPSLPHSGIIVAQSQRETGVESANTSSKEFLCLEEEGGRELKQAETPGSIVVDPSGEPVEETISLDRSSTGDVSLKVGQKRELEIRGSSREEKEGGHPTKNHSNEALFTSETCIIEKGENEMQEGEGIRVERAGAAWKERVQKEEGLAMHIEERNEATVGRKIVEKETPRRAPPLPTSTTIRNASPNQQSAMEEKEDGATQGKTLLDLPHPIDVCSTISPPVLRRKSTTITSANSTPQSRREGREKELEVLEKLNELEARLICRLPAYFESGKNSRGHVIAVRRTEALKEEKRGEEVDGGHCLQQSSRYEKGRGMECSEGEPNSSIYASTCGDMKREDILGGGGGPGNGRYWMHLTPRFRATHEGKVVEVKGEMLRAEGGGGRGGEDTARGSTPLPNGSLNAVRPLSLTPTGMVTNKEWKKRPWNAGEFMTGGASIALPFTAEPCEGGIVEKGDEREDWLREEGRAIPATVAGAARVAVLSSPVPPLPLLSSSLSEPLIGSKAEAVPELGLLTVVGTTEKINEKVLSESVLTLERKESVDLRKEALPATSPSSTGAECQKESLSISIPPGAALNNENAKETLPEPLVALLDSHSLPSSSKEMSPKAGTPSSNSPTSSTSRGHSKGHYDISSDSTSAESTSSESPFPKRR